MDFFVIPFVVSNYFYSLTTFLIFSIFSFGSSFFTTGVGAGFGSAFSSGFGSTFSSGFGSSTLVGAGSVVVDSYSLWSSVVAGISASTSFDSSVFASSFSSSASSCETVYGSGSGATLSWVSSTLTVYFFSSLVCTSGSSFLAVSTTFSSSWIDSYTFSITFSVSYIFFFASLSFSFFYSNSPYFTVFSSTSLST